MGGQLNYFGFWLNENFGLGYSRGQFFCIIYGSLVFFVEEEFKFDRFEVWGVGVLLENEVGVFLVKLVIFCLFFYKRVIFIGLAIGLLVRFRVEGKGEIVGSQFVIGVMMFSYVICKIKLSIQYFLKLEKCLMFYKNFFDDLLIFVGIFL